MAPKLSKKERKRLKAEQAAAEASGEKKADAPPQKKQKAEGGKAVPVSTGKETQPNGAAAPAKKEKEKVSGEKKGKEKNGTDKKETAAGEPVQHPNGLIITDTKLGTGATAKKGSRLGMRYIGKLSNGTVFDSNTSGKPVSTDHVTGTSCSMSTFTSQLKFQLGKGEVIKGESSRLPWCAHS
jgi:FK506-binding nuclear protein